MSYAPALALTLLVEVPVYTAAITLTTPVRARRAALAAVAANCLTHPVLWWSLSRAPAGGAGYWALFCGAEAAVCAVEGALVARWLRSPGPLPYAASVAANTASVLAGMVLLSGG